MSTNTGGAAVLDRRMLAAAILEAANSGRGALDGWLETVNEAEVREAVLGLADSSSRDRDHFAAKAMAALIGTAAGPCIVNGLDGTESCVARAAYRMADAMLAARSTEAK